MLEGRGRKLSLLSPRRCCFGASPNAAAAKAIMPYTGGAVSVLLKSVALRSGDGGRGASAVVGTVGGGRDGKSRPRSLGCRPMIVGLAGLLLSFSDLGSALYTRGGVLAPQTVKGNLARAVY
jgi:hypothetical protein